jgi:RNA recognition motif-containing protein
MKLDDSKPEVAAELESITGDGALKTESDVGHPEAPAESTAAADGSEFAEPAASAAEATQDGYVSQSETAYQEPLPRLRGISRQSNNQPLTSVYVGNLFFEVTEETLRKEFERFGEIQSVKVVTDARGLSRGFGFVEFVNIDSATQAVEELDQQLLEGRRLSVQFNKPKERAARNITIHPPTTTLFIGNMSFEMSDRDLSDLFRDMRNVKDVRVAIDRNTGQCRGFTHADFHDLESAKEAYDKLQGKVIYGRALRVDYSTPSSSTRQVRRD